VTASDDGEFSECETVVVNAHGCAMLSRVKFESGTSLRLHNKEGGKTTARVISCQPSGSDDQNWKLGARLDRPGNFWGLKDCPQDWALPTRFVTLRQPQAAPVVPSPVASPGEVVRTSDQVSDQLARQIQLQVQRMIVESQSPLQAEITTLKQKLDRREANPSRFEVSLSSIPPELEQQMELRLRKVLGPRILDETHQQSAQILAGAKASIEKQTTDSYRDFVYRVKEELSSVEKRAKDISAHISAHAQENFRRGSEDFQQKLLDGGNSLKRLTDELLEYLQQNLNDEHNARRADLEELRASISNESSRLHQRVEHLDQHIARLDESARTLESGLTQRLSQMASNTIKDTRNQLEGVMNEILEELTTRAVTSLGNQLEEATANMKIVQKGILASVSESMKAQAASSLQAFGQSTEELANDSVERLRVRLKTGLEALTKNVGEQFQSERESADRGTQR
jgi:hypothetical protein